MKVHAANLRDTKSACGVLEGVVNKYPSLKAFSGDREIPAIEAQRLTSQLMG
ncbi:hypothetical protein [Nitrosomonas sp. Nm58]|uniref:hypothetical protein n=1 Tax=Nitrosomonas sp. Nm58 TaxID=200126 RepID=UPI0015A6F562|nr:hypothetical protein [Nitrosomonas sp. Nm58]